MIDPNDRDRCAGCARLLKTEAEYAVCLCVKCDNDGVPPYDPRDYDDRYDHDGDYTG